MRVKSSRQGDNGRIPGAREDAPIPAVMARGANSATSGSSEPWVATVDDPAGLPLSEARTMARRFWVLGWFGLPLAWATNAYYFWPHVKGDSNALEAEEHAEMNAGSSDSRTRSGGASPNNAGGRTTRLDPIVKKYATQSYRGAQASFVVLLAWATTFLVGGKGVFGETLWNQLSVTAQPPAE